MRINLPSAILLSGTVMLLSAAGAIAESTDTAVTPPADAGAVQPVAAESKSTVTATDTAAKPSSAEPGATEATAAAGQPSEAHSRPPMHGSFQFDLDNEKEAIVDAPDKIEKARELHKKAMEQAKAGDSEGALKTEQEATLEAPHYWLPHAGMVYLIMSNHKRPTDALNEASKSIYGKHGTVAERNTAKLFQQVHWIPPAIKALEKAVRIEPDNWKNRIALADAYASSGQMDKAYEQLEAIKAESLTQYAPLDNLATHYMSIDQYAKAKPLLERALALAPNDKEKHSVQDRQFIVALKLSDKAEMQRLLDLVSDDLKKERPDAVLEARLAIAANPAAADEIFNMAANIQSKYGDKTFFAIGREMLKRAEATTSAEHRAWLKKADAAFKNAASRNQTETNYRIADVAVLEMLGDGEGLARALQELKESLPAGSESLKLSDVQPIEANRKILDFQRYNLVKAFEPRTNANSDPTVAVYRSNAHQLQYRVMKTACACHARSMRKALGQEPGVMFTAQTNDEKPLVTIVFDPRFNSVKKLMGSKIFEQIKDPIGDVTDKPIESLSQLNTLVMATADQKPMVQLKRGLAYEMPFDTSGQVAQTSETH